MSENNPSSKTKRPGAGAQDGAQKALLCEEWEALLVDALDGKLSGTEAAAFETHREKCLACAQLLEEAKRGAEWLHFLETEPEVPADLVGRILAQTSGAMETLPAAPAGFGIPATPGGIPVVVPVAGGWVAGWLPKVERQAVQARWMMTAAMAFFSIAFTLNLTGVKLSGFRLADLRPTTLATNLTRQFYAADKGVMRYYDSLTFFYEVESRVREMKRIVEPVPSSDKSTAAPRGDDKTDRKPSGKPAGGSAERSPAVPAPVVQPMGEPVMAKLDKTSDTSFAEQPMGAEPVCFRIHKETKPKEDQQANRWGTSIRAERSLA